MFKRISKIIVISVLVSFIVSSVQMPVFAQIDPLPFMPAPGTMVNLSPEFTPAYLKGIVIHPKEPLKFDFIIYKGDKPLSDSQKREEYTKLTKYFLASLAIPDDDQWVNLSPYEKDRIIKDDFGKTEMGRDLLAQDYMLKQITASLIYPENNLGKEFWSKVYAQAQKQYGTSNIPVNTFNKVWILPDDALIYEKGNTAYVLKNHLRVMLEEDYLSLAKHEGQPGDMFKSELQGTCPQAGCQPSEPLNLKAPQGDTHYATPPIHSIASQIIKQIVLPELQREVNEDKNFAPLRQVYSGMLLATWFKRTLKQSLLGQIYANKGKVRGIDQDPRTNEEIYHRYLQAYKKGVFNFIKEDVDKYTNETIPRKYFSGGAIDFNAVQAILHVNPIRLINKLASNQEHDAAQILSQRADVVLEVFNRARGKTDEQMTGGQKDGAMRSVDYFADQPIGGPSYENIRAKNKKWVVFPRGLHLPEKINVVDQDNDKLPKDVYLKFEADTGIEGFIRIEYFKNGERMRFGHIALFWNEKSLAWVVEGHYIESKDARGNGIGGSTIKLLGNYFGVLASAHQSSTESDAIEMWKRIGAEKEEYAQGLEAFFYRNKKAEEAMTSERRGDHAVANQRDTAVVTQGAHKAMIHDLKSDADVLLNTLWDTDIPGTKVNYTVDGRQKTVATRRALAEAAARQRSIRLSKVVRLEDFRRDMKTPPNQPPDDFLVPATRVKLATLISCIERFEALINWSANYKAPNSPATPVQRIYFKDKILLWPIVVGAALSSNEEYIMKWLAGKIIDRFGGHLKIEHLHYIVHYDREITNLEGEILAYLAETRSGMERDKGDAAMVGQRKNVKKDRANTFKPGGIDMNAANLAMTIKRDGNGVPIFSQQDLAQLGRNLEGLFPVILSIKPASQTALFADLSAHP